MQKNEDMPEKAARRRLWLLVHSSRGRLPRPDETGLPREAMPPSAGRMAKQGEEENNASAGRCTRRSRFRCCEQSCSATGRAWSSCGTSGTRSTTSGTFCSIGGSDRCGGCVRAEHRTRQSQTSSEKTRGSAARSSREELLSVPGPDVSQPRGAWEA